MRSINLMGAKNEAMLEKMLSVRERAAIFSIWDVEHYRPDPEHGGLHLLSMSRDGNLVTDQGLNSILDVYFKSGTQLTTWYCAIFDDNYTVLSSNTYATPGYSENTAYDEATRPQWVGGTVSGQSVDNSASKATFTMNATHTIYGASLVGGGSTPSTKDDTAGGGTLYCAAQFSASKAVEDNDVLKVTVTLTSSSV